MHVNKELKGWLTSPLNRWQDLEDMIPKFDRKWPEADCPVWSGMQEKRTLCALLSGITGQLNTLGQDRSPSLRAA